MPPCDAAGGRDSAAGVDTLTHPQAADTSRP